MRTFVLAILAFLAGAHIASAQVTAEPAQTTVCEISKDEAGFNGKRVHVRAVFTAWWEGSRLRDKACPLVGYDFRADYAAPADKADPTVNAFIDAFASKWRDDLIDYDVEFDATFHNEDYEAGWGFKSHGVLEVTHVTGWTATPHDIGH